MLVDKFIIICKVKLLIIKITFKKKMWKLYPYHMGNTRIRIECLILLALIKF